MYVCVLEFSRDRSSISLAMKFTSIIVLTLSVNAVLCKEQHASAHSRVRRDGWWTPVLSAIGSLFSSPASTGGGMYQGGGMYPGGSGMYPGGGGMYPGGGGMYPGGGGMYPGGGGMYPGGGGTYPGGGMGPGGLQGQQGSQCHCNQIRGKRDTDFKDLQEAPASSETYSDDAETRVVGGQAVRPGQYPSIVIVTYDGNQHCGGTVINEKYVLTAAHCVFGRSDPARFGVIAGVFNMRQQESGRVTIPVVNARYHPNYNAGGKYNNDVAILELANLLQFVPGRIQPTCLPRYQRRYDGHPALVAGWGKTSESGSSSAMLQHVMVPVMNNQECTNMMENKYTITDNMLCAGIPQGGRDSCAGDSGGPLFMDGNQGHLQIGVVSFGEGCARANRPGVYARLDKEMDFIQANSKISQGCSVYTM